METLDGSLYDYPQYYDLVFGSDWKAEYDFLLWCFQHLSEMKVSRVFEPACGTGRLLYRLGKAGFEVGGLDLNANAVDYCNKRLVRHGLQPTATLDDMCDFHLSRKVHAAFNMINSFRHLTSHRAALKHLQCVATNLTKGGIYVLGLHLLPTAGEPMGEESWSAQRGHLCVNTHLWTIDRNTRRRQERFRMVYDIYTPTKNLQLTDELVFRTYTAAQFNKLIAEVPEFEIAAIYDFAYDVDSPITLEADVEDAVFVLRKR